MEINYQGDLADIIRASGGAMSASRGGLSSGVHVEALRFSADPMMNYPSGMEETVPADDFGDPFSNMRDPLLQELDMPPSSCFEDATPQFGGSSILAYQKKILDEEDMKRPCNNNNNNNNNNNIFSRMLQISPNAKLPPLVVMTALPPGIKASPLVPNNEMISVAAAAKTTSKSCLVENTGVVQISSPRNTSIKRRKSQAKKVVCIPAPAPAPANTRPRSGEVVPSDLWAWRKYGQKPIKGSPYPRGYYRCSSSKGCSARKQVERSWTDPNMLVVTYTCEHNHPWPTQRNALAGSTRSHCHSQPTKNNSSNSKNSPGTSFKEEQKLTNTADNMPSSSTTNVGPPPTVKEEMKYLGDDDDHKQIHMDNDDDSSGGGEISEGFPYRPALPDSNNNNNNNNNQSSEDLFADLGEIEADPLNLLFHPHPRRSRSRGGGERKQQGLGVGSIQQSLKLDREQQQQQPHTIWKSIQ